MPGTMFREHPPSFIRDTQPRHLRHLAVYDHALSVRGNEPATNKLDQQFDPESVRKHQGFGAAAWTPDKQFEGLVPVGPLGTAVPAHGPRMVAGRGRHVTSMA